MKNVRPPTGRCPASRPKGWRRTGSARRAIPPLLLAPMGVRRDIHAAVGAAAAMVGRSSPLFQTLDEGVAIPGSALTLSPHPVRESGGRVPQMGGNWSTGVCVRDEAASRRGAGPGHPADRSGRPFATSGVRGGFVTERKRRGFWRIPGATTTPALPPMEPRRADAPLAVRRRSPRSPAPRSPAAGRRRSPPCPGPGCSAASPRPPSGARSSGRRPRRRPRPRPSGASPAG